MGATHLATLLGALALGVLAGGPTRAEGASSASADVSASIIEPMGAAAPAPLVFSTLTRPKEGTVERRSSAEFVLHGAPGQSVQIVVSGSLDAADQGSGARLNLRAVSPSVLLSGRHVGSAQTAVLADLSVTSEATRGQRTGAYTVHAVYE
jgi:hypothetical protein